MNLKIMVINLLIPLLILQEVSSEHYEFSSGISNYQKLDIEGNYSYLAQMCEGELFMTDLQFKELHIKTQVKSNSSLLLRMIYFN